MEYKKLYSKAFTGAIQVWWMETSREGFPDNIGPKGFYRSHSGQLNGKITTSEWTEVQEKNSGKSNSTDGYEQAEKEVKAKYKKKLKQDYFENIEDVDKTNFIQPMLAKNFKDYKDKISYPVYVQCKLNGFRCIATKEGLFTRTGERYLSVPHIMRGLENLFTADPKVILDGELFNYAYRQSLNEISKLVRKTVNITEQDLKDSESKVQYHIYDIVDPTDTFIRRDERVESIISNLSLKYFKTVKTLTARSEFELNEIYNSFVEEGHEGAIIRTNGNYENKRSKNLLKLKPEDDAEFLLIGVEEGKGDWSGKAKRVKLKMDNGKEFDGSFKGTMEEAVYFLHNKDSYIGNKVTIKFNGYTGLGTPNYAQYDFNNQK